MVSWLPHQSSNPAIRHHFPGGEYDLLFNIDIDSEPSFKKQRR